MKSPIARRRRNPSPPSRRDRLADDLEHPVTTAGTAKDPWSYSAPGQRSELVVARGLIHDLACRLREPGSVPPATLRALERLLSDPRSPLYSPAAPGALLVVILDAISAIDHARAGAH
jgi:hypothetical protein